MELCFSLASNPLHRCKKNVLCFYVFMSVVRGEPLSQIVCSLLADHSDDFFLPQILHWGDYQFYSRASQPWSILRYTTRGVQWIDRRLVLWSRSTRSPWPHSRCIAYTKTMTREETLPISGSGFTVDIHIFYSEYKESNPELYSSVVFPVEGTNYFPPLTIL